MSDCVERTRGRRARDTSFPEQCKASSVSPTPCGKSRPPPRVKKFRVSLSPHSLRGGGSQCLPLAARVLPRDNVGKRPVWRLLTITCECRTICGNRPLNSAERQGRTADDLVTDALKRYIAHENLEELSRYGRDRAKALGLDKPTEEEALAFVEGVIREDRTERR